MNRNTVAELALTILAIAPGVDAQRLPSVAQPEKLLEAVNVQTGGTFCEIGAGEGDTSIAVARLLGPSGRVFASELGDSRLARLRAMVASSALSNITVVPGDPATTNFPDAACDGIFMRDVYHHLSDPASINESIFAALKPGGRVAVIDFKPPAQEAERPVERSKAGKHGISPETVSRELKVAGFEPVSPSQPRQHGFMVVFSKPAK